MTRTQKSFVACALVTACLAALPSLAQRGAKKQFGETVEVLTVQLPIQVLRDDEPVRGLTEDNFEIYDGRKRQQITGFEVVDLSESGEQNLANQQLPITARRHFLLLFDLSFADPTVISRAREAALDLVEKQFHPSDLVGVATYSVQHGPQLILGFTPDRRQVRLAIETLGLPQLLERATDPLSFVIADVDLHKTPSEGGGNSGGRNIDTEALFEEQVRDYSIGFDRAQRGEAQGQVAALTRQLQDLAKALNDVKGRKHVVYLSEGFDSELILGTDDAARNAEMASASATGRYWEIDSEERYGSTGTLTAVQNMLEEFRRADCTIQAVDIGGLRAGADSQGRAGGQDSLFMMANQTGGDFYRNFNNLGGAMQEMLERTSVTYLVSFQPDVKLDGDFHKLRIELAGVPKGARLVHRPGFYAPTPYAERGAIAKRLEAADRLLSDGRDSGLSSSVVAAPFRAEGGRAYVPVLIELDGPTLLAGQKGDTASLEIYAYAIASDGTVGDFLSQNMGLQIAKVRAALEQSGLKFFGDLNLAPGDYVLRVLVRDSQNGRTTTRNLPIVVPEFGSGAPSLAMPLFPEPGGKWLMVQEANGADARQSRPYPFQLQGNPFMPAAKPFIKAGTEAQFVLLGYNLGDDAIPLETQLITAAGETVEGSRIAFVGRDQGASPDATQLLLSLQTEGLPAGEYRLVTSLQGQETSTSIPFVVTGG
jgi:VWFA-related protein